MLTLKYQAIILWIAILLLAAISYHASAEVTKNWVIKAVVTQQDQEPTIYTSGEAFESEEVCDATRLGDETVSFSIVRLKKYLAETKGGVVFGSVCVNTEERGA